MYVINSHCCNFQWSNKETTLVFQCFCISLLSLTVCDKNYMILQNGHDLKIPGAGNCLVKGRQSFKVVVVSGFR